MQERFAVIHDPRQQGYVKHRLCDILVMVMYAVVCGIDELGNIATFLENRAAFFKDNFKILSIPSKATLSRVLRIIDGKQVANIMLSIMQDYIHENESQIAVDGKAIRSTSKEGQPRSALQIITAYMTESGVVLAQEKIHEKTNEIPVFQDILNYLNVKDKTVTADAMHCQKKTCEKIIANGGKYVFGLKGNQGTLHKDIALFFEDTPKEYKIEKFATLEKHGDRLEKRVCRMCTCLDWLEGKSDWTGLTSILAVDREVTTKKGTYKETSYYIDSFLDSADNFLKIIRGHWKIESMHWLLDVTFSEDFANFSSEETHFARNAMRKCALLWHREYLKTSSKKRSIKSNMLSCLLDEKLLLDVISLP